jgi:hypothetical protein
MHNEGLFAPETASDAREQYDAVGPTAQTVVREVARAMEFGKDEYEDRVTGTVIETARDAIFASLLKVCVGSDAEFEAWCAEHDDYEVREIGNENVANVVWHAVPFENVVVAATFQEKEDAAIGTLRRQVFGSVYRDVVTDYDDE